MKSLLLHSSVFERETLSDCGHGTPLVRRHFLQCFHDWKTRPLKMMDYLEMSSDKWKVVPTDRPTTAAIAARSVSESATTEVISG